MLGLVDAGGLESSGGDRLEADIAEIADCGGDEGCRGLR